DMDLARLCAELAGQSRQAVDWLQDNAELVGSESAALQKDMRHAARFFSKCEQAARRKMCVGVFGPSQSGKSYLISALARDPQGALLADFAGRTCDFITEINPEGGKESTGLVTRFTTTPPAGASPEFPIRLRLLTEADVVRVLANTYYADCEHKEAPDPDPLMAALNELSARAAMTTAEASGVSADDVEDIRDYINKNFSSRPRVQMLQRMYWQQAMQLAPRLALEDRARLFGLIWDSVPQFAALYLKLCGALRALGFPAEAGCPLEALIPRKNSIIDVALLRGLNDEDSDSLQMLGAGGRTAELPRALVTALTAEITIRMRDKPDDFFDYTDLLDFPGYRSRLKLENLQQELDRPRDDKGLGLLENLFLRGKVAYLFERYCEEKELTSMLLCIGPGNQEVQDLPRAVYEWICSTHGENPAHRAGKDPALFFVLSKMDMEFEKKKGAPSVEARWSIRLQSSLLDFFGKQHDWPTNWDGKGPFNNVFLLRNPNFRCEAIF
ncbi:MAG: virulence factor SrfC family protein, partial [Desulfovibrionaceae bacterium]|nr:virulence factor SrfC family protein [Desulfovibrionaceae bacterium]